MSMNLCFDIKNVLDHIDFPWQTSTKITYAVLNAKTINEKLQILRDSISYLPEDEIEQRMKKVEALINSKHLTLGMI